MINFGLIGCAIGVKILQEILQIQDRQDLALNLVDLQEEDDT